jgi:virginiamycin B lyase
MRSLAPKLLAAAIALVAMLAWAPAAGAVPTYTGNVKVSSLGSNNKIVAGPDGNMWMTLSDATNNVARITPLGVVTEFDLENVEQPTGITVGPEGALWVTLEKAVAKFSVADPTKATVTPISQVEGPSSIVAGPDGQLWVAAKGNVVHFLPSKPAGATPIPVAGLMPKDIDVAGGLLAIADSGNKRIVTVNTSGVVQPDIPLGGATETSQGIAGGLGGQIAFSKSDGTEGLGLVTPPGTPTAALMPGDPFGVALGSDGAYWFAMSAAKGLERLTTTGQATALPFTGLNPEFFPRQIASGPGNTLWVTLENGGEMKSEVARIIGLEPPVATTTTTPPPLNPITVSEKPVPDSRFGKGPKRVVTTSGAKATVKFTFFSSVPGSSFQCRLIKVQGGKRKKAKASRATFAGCRSPKVLHLVPGKYRFAVRATAAGAIEGSPAEKAFKVVRLPRHR